MEHEQQPPGAVAFATQHRKELQFGPPLRRVLGLEVFVAGIDTDEFGTFTGEVPRPAGQLETAVRKARWGVEHTGARFGLASEGAFGPHPEVPFVAIGRELAVFVDSADTIEVVEGMICPDTNFAHVTLRSPEVPDDFLSAMGFPDHAVIVSPTESDGPFVKGIQDRATLDAAVAATFSEHGTAAVQTDMRAHLNPTRQRALAQLAERLATRISTRCPQCAACGWGIIGAEPGLPCEWCGRATSVIAGDRYGCASKACDHDELQRREGVASPGSCQFCNP